MGQDISLMQEIGNDMERLTFRSGWEVVEKI
jgi:hypothetical protein